MTEHKAASDHEEGFLTETEQLDKSLPDSSGLCQPEQKTQTDAAEFSDEFVPGTTCK